MPDAEDLDGPRRRSRDRGRGHAEDSAKGKGKEKEIQSASGKESKRTASQERNFQEMQTFLDGVDLGAWAEDFYAEGFDTVEDLKLAEEEDLATLAGTGMVKGHVRRLLSALKKLG